MIQRQEDRPLTAAAWRQLMHACVSVEDMEGVVQALISAAKGGEQSAQELLIRYTVGTPYKATQPVEVLDLPELEDLDSCVRAINVVLEAHSQGRISDLQARSYRETITAAAGVMRAEIAQQDEASLLFEKGSTVVYPEAGVDPAEAFRRAVEADGRSN